MKRCVTISLPDQELYKIALIADTHGLVRAELFNLLADVDLIIHAGDVCGEGVLEELRMIAPVVAVCGNMDQYERYTSPLPAFISVSAGEFVIHVVHDLNDILPKINSLTLSDEPFRKHIVVFGHTHNPVSYIENGVYFINPGSCGPKRSGKPVSYAILTLSIVVDVDFYDI